MESPGIYCRNFQGICRKILENCSADLENADVLHGAKLLPNYRNNKIVHKQTKRHDDRTRLR